MTRNTLSLKSPLKPSSSNSEEREDKHDLDFPVWPPEFVRRIGAATDSVALTDMELRHYRTTVMDTEAHNLRRLGYELRRRSTINWNVDPNHRVIQPNSTDLCMKSRRQLSTRQEFEVAHDGPAKDGYDSLSVQSRGLVYRLFRNAAIQDPESDIVDLAVGDVQRHYRELTLPITPAGCAATSASQKAEEVILSLCLDSVEVLGRTQSGLLMIVGQLAQLEIENKNKVCPHEGRSQRITSARATRVQIEGAMQEAREIWLDALPSHVTHRAQASQKSKTSFILDTTTSWRNGRRLAMAG